MPARPIELSATPAEVLARWPAERPLAMLWSGSPPRPESRWTILAAPRRTRFLDPGTTGARAAIGELCRVPTQLRGFEAEAPPFVGGTLLWLAYGLGGVIEPAAATGSRPAQGLPLMVSLECPDAVVFDHGFSRWWGIGQYRPLLADVHAEKSPPIRTGAWRHRTGRKAYEAAVAQALEYIRAGDVYQVNLAHRLEAGFSGPPRAYARRMLAAARPWYGAYAEFVYAGASHALVSCSPELFLQFNPDSRRMLTRPMKGTRRAGADPQELRDAPKDRAELDMIIDLMRNDLGRVCELGTVRVDSPRRIERHGRARWGVLQATGSVSGVLRGRLDVTDAIIAAFPAGSVTGAPKIRAMRIIDELEPYPRGFYCGAAGYISRSGHAALNVAIRTATISGIADAARPGCLAEGVISYSVGAGIVADSVPSSEWSETLDKAFVLRTSTRARAGSGR